MIKRLLFLVCFLYVSISCATVRYVTVVGAGAMDGSSWANAAPGGALQNMISLSAANDQVWVASGTYYPTNTANRTLAFTMKNGVAIYGGFAGTETALTQRSFQCGPGSILSGEIGAVGNSDNSYHVISNGNGITNSAVLDGFVIRDANDNRPATDNDGLGGGIYNNGSNGGQCSPTIRNCIIINNKAVFGAGIFNNGYNTGNANPMIVNCIIANNNATSGGGGIDNFGLAGTASPTIINSVIYNNTATERAGAMYCWGGNNGNASPTVLNTVFAKNTAANGGGIVSDRLNSSTGSSGNSNPVFTNCIFWGNTASSTGNQFYSLGSGTFTATYTAFDITGQTSPHVLSGSTTGNITANPLLVNIENGAGADGCWLTNDDGLRLQTASPGINTGNNSNVTATDLTGRQRILGGTVDMGAYETESTGVVTALEDVLDHGIRLYPNPAVNEIHIEHNQYEGGAAIYVYSTLGEIIYQGHSTQQHEVINVSALAKGVYMIHVIQRGKVHRMKWVKQ